MNKLAKDFGFFSLFKFVAPTIIMMIFMSIYSMVDGIFVSNLVSENALSAVNIVFPALSVILGISIMLATGGSAVIAKKMGEGKNEQAKQNFTLIVIVGVIIGFLIIGLGAIFIEDIIKMLGATELLHNYAYDYLIVILFFAPMAVLQVFFQYFFVTSGKPKLGLIFTIAGGLTNIILDYVFIAVFNMGVAGAAFATGLGWSIIAIAGLIYFSVNKKNTLHFVKPKIDLKMLLGSCANGSSEMVTNLAGAVTTLLFNITMLKYLGEDGVAAITIILYSQFLLTSLYFGFSSGIAPIFSYKHGNENFNQIKKLFKISMWFIIISSIIIFILSITLAGYITNIFVQQDSNVYGIAVKGFMIFSIGYIFAGINIFASSLFTAFSNGKVSALISFLRTFAFIIPAIIFLPMIMGETGIWIAVPIAELLTIVLSIIFLVKHRDIYKY